MTLPREFRHIWRSRRSVAKVAFLLNRYWTLVLTIISLTLKYGLWTHKSCLWMYRFQPFGALPVFTICEFTFALVSGRRACALLDVLYLLLYSYSSEPTHSGIKAAPFWVFWSSCSPPFLFWSAASS
jgi:hypothetical protein